MAKAQGNNKMSSNDPQSKKTTQGHGPNRRFSKSQKKLGVKKYRGQGK